MNTFEKVLVFLLITTTVLLNSLSVASLRDQVSLLENKVSLQENICNKE